MPHTWRHTGEAMEKLEHIIHQFQKLFAGKTILVLDVEDMEELILAAVPALHMEIESLVWEKDRLSYDDLRRQERLQRLEKKLDLIPRPVTASVIDFTQQLH
jgi:hypothetical protein